MKLSFSSKLCRMGLLLVAAGFGWGCESDEPENGVGGAGEGGAGVALANGGSDGSLVGNAGSEGGAGGGEAEAGAGGGGGESGVLRLMALGDSVTRATCWRALLWEKLNQSFTSRFDFVGMLGSADSCSPAGYDRDNQAYSSSLITEIVAGITTARTCDPNPCPAMTDLQAAFAAATPDIALIHFGTNDVWNGRAAADILNGYSAVVDALRAANPTVNVLVAQIIPMNVTAATCPGCTCAGCPTAIPALNTEIVTWAEGKSTAESPIIVVDQYTGFDVATDTGDGVHPNLAGSQKMADAWYEALEPLF